MRHLLCTCLLLSAPSMLPAQWRVALLVGSASSHGDARDDADPAHPEIHAEAPSARILSIAREGGSWRLGIELHQLSADLAELSAGSAVMTRNLLKAWGAAVEFAHRMIGSREGPAVLVATGVGADRWRFDLADGAPRWRTAVRGAVDVELPISAAWRGVVRGQATVGPSVFKTEELPDGFRPRTAVRIGLLVGIARRLH